MLNTVLKVLVALPAVLFLVMGLRWLVDPAGIAPQMGLSLETGAGLSTQVGDLSAFMLLLGICMLCALVSGRRFWYYPPIILMLLAVVGRVVAWLFHDAALPASMVAPELIIPAILWLASRRLPVRD